MYTAKFDTLRVSHVFVTLEAIIHDSSVSDGAIPASDQFRGSKADMQGNNCSAQCLRHGMQPILLHV